MPSWRRSCRRGRPPAACPSHRCAACTAGAAGAALQGDRDDCRPLVVACTGAKRSPQGEMCTKYCLTLVHNCLTHASLSLATPQPFPFEGCPPTKAGPCHSPGLHHLTEAVQAKVRMA